MNNIVVQRLKKNYSNRIDKAITYFSILDALNSLSLTKKQIELLAYTSLRGTISSLSSKEDFVKQFGSSVDSINNMISKLYKKKLLIKHKDGKIKIPKSLVLDFDNSEIVLNITIGTIPVDNES